MTQDITHFVNSCHTCQVTGIRRPIKAPLQPFLIQSVPFASVCLDIVRPLHPSSSRGHKSILTLVDSATRYADATPLHQIDAETVAGTSLQMCLYVGFPTYVTTDNGNNFTSRHFREITELMAARHKITLP